MIDTRTINIDADQDQDNSFAGLSSQDKKRKNFKPSSPSLFDQISTTATSTPFENPVGVTVSDAYEEDCDVKEYVHSIGELYEYMQKAESNEEKSLLKEWFQANILDIKAWILFSKCNLGPKLTHKDFRGTLQFFHVADPEGHPNPCLE